MKRFKKLLSTLLVCIMILGSVSVCSAGNIDVLKGLEIAPDSFAEAVGDEPITRGEYAYMMANILNSDDMDPMDTRFTDVTKADYFSGQIEYLATRGVAGGYGDGTFGKDDPMTLETAYVFLIRLLGYESFVRINEASQSNFTTFAYTIGLKAGTYTNAEGYVTKSGAAAIVHDALTAELPKAEWSTEGGELILNTNQGATTNLLSKNLGISAYDAYVQGVDMEKYAVTLEITKNKYKTNPLAIAEGTVKTFLASTNVNIYEYDHTPVSVWVNEDEKIIDIQYKKDVEIRYVNIVSVNGDDAEHSYRVGNIERMTFLDDEEEYDVATGATYKINGEDFTGQTALAGNYAKIVLIRNEITHVESWDLREGGIIEEVAEDKLTYKQGNARVVLRDLDKFKTKMYFIGGRNASANELREGALFYYYKNEATGYIAFVISEVIITDILNGVGTDSLTIGNNILNYDTKFYFQTEGDTFKTSDTNRDFVDLYNKNVHAYVAHNGKVLYLFPEDASLITGGFYGVVVGIEPDKWEPELADIKLIRLNGTEITEHDYKITEKTIYKDSLSLADLRANARDKYGKGIYKFRVNAAGDVTQVSKPQPFPGFSTAETSRATVTTDFYGMTDGSIYFNLGGGVGRAFMNPSLIYTIDEINGQFTVDTMTASDIKSKKPPTGGLNVIVYGEGKSLTPALMVITSKEGTSNLSAFGKGSVQTGVITAMTSVNDDGIQKTKLVIQGTAGIKDYLVMPSTVTSKGLAKDVLIKYSPNGEGMDDQINISETADLSGEPETWNLSGVLGGTQQAGIVDVAEDRGLILEDGTIGFYYPSRASFFIADLTGKERKYEGGKSTDIATGDYVIFYRGEGINSMVMIVKR